MVFPAMDRGPVPPGSPAIDLPAGMADPAFANEPEILAAPEPVPSYSEADVPSTAAEALAWMDAASSDEDHIARAETLAAANAGRRKPWASVSKATAEVLG